MDLRAHYRKRRQIESTIQNEFVVVVSLETVDGGRAGIMTEVSREQAAALIVDGKARLATEEEATEQREEARRRRAEAEQLQAASRVQLSVLSEQELKQLRSALRSSKS